MKNLFLSLLLCVLSLSLFALDDESLYREERFYECRSRLEADLGSAGSAGEKAEILWKLARVQVSIGDLLEEDDKAGRFAEYEKGIAHAEESIANRPSAMAYLWKASNTGRWGQTKGPLDSLGKAKGMKEDLLTVVDTFSRTDSAEAWYVLACLYDQLPGSPLSFGNKNWAISYIRAGVDSIPSDTLYPGHYLALAKMLYKRNWDAKKRRSAIGRMEGKWKKESLNSEKYKYYEGRDGADGRPFYSSVSLAGMSDRQEAAMVVQYALNKYDVWPDRKASMDKEIAELRALLEKWT